MLQLTHRQDTRTLEEEMFDHLKYITHPECEEWSNLPQHIEDRFIAAGYFSSVWSIPGEPYQVLKVSHRETDACRHYLEWVHTKPHPNAPKIYSITHIEDMMFIRMQRYELHPERHNLTAKDDIPGYKVLFGLKRPNHKLGHEQLCATIRREFANNKFDLHSANIMVDRNMTIIITDPVSYVGTTERDDSCYS